VVPALPEALELYGNVPFSMGAAMGAWESSESFEDCELYGNIPFSVGAAMGVWESSESFEHCFFGVPPFPGVTPLHLR